MQYGNQSNKSETASDTDCSIPTNQKRYRQEAVTVFDKSCFSVIIKNSNTESRLTADTECAKIKPIFGSAGVVIFTKKEYHT